VKRQFLSRDDAARGQQILTTLPMSPDEATGIVRAWRAERSAEKGRGYDH
jgi:hypothetical protein